MHRTVHRLSCYMNIPKYSKLFIQIVQETSVRENDCPGNVLYGNNRRVRARSCPGNVCPGKWLSGETSVTHLDQAPRFKMGHVTSISRGNLSCVCLVSFKMFDIRKLESVLLLSLLAWHDRMPTCDRQTHGHSLVYTVLSIVSYGTHQLRRHCVYWPRRDVDPPPPPKIGHSSSPNFSVHVYCGQTAGLVKVSPLSPPLKGAQQPVCCGQMVAHFRNCRVN